MKSIRQVIDNAAYNGIRYATDDATDYATDIATYATYNDTRYVIHYANYNGTDYATDNAVYFALKRNVNHEI